jgi:hypothetical protein
MKKRSSRRTFLQTGFALPAAGLVIPPGVLEAAFQQPAAKKPPVFEPPSGYTDSGKYGKYVIKEPYAKYHQLENVTVTPEQLMADCIITHQVFYKPEVIVREPHSHDFVEIIGCLGSNPMNCREFDAEIIWCLGEEREEHIINVPTVISMAKGLLHGPIEITKINAPFIFLEVMLTDRYSIEQPMPKMKPPA